MRRSIQIFIACAGVCLAAVAHAASAPTATFAVGIGDNFIPGSSYVSLAWRRDGWAVEGMLMRLGREEPTTKPGPEMSVDVLRQLPWWGLFVRGGVVAGWGKKGYDLGLGVDVPLATHWALRLQDRHVHATEDQIGGAESENIVSLGVDYRW